MKKENTEMILAISGSPRKNGNTAEVLQYLLDKCAQKNIKGDLINLADLTLAPCNVCEICKKQVNCSINDDYNSLIPKITAAKIIVVGTPVYFGTVSAQLKIFMDRTLGLRRNGFMLEHKFGAGVAIGGSRNGGQEFTIQTIQNWMKIQGMLILPDGKPTSHFGGTLVGREKGAALKDQDGMATINSLIENIVSITNKFKLK
jgi:multimeric flavodoxin WrbA